MGAGEARRFDHRLVGGVAHPRDVVAHRAGEQLDVLGQIADVAAEIAAVPGVHLGAVEPDVSGSWRPDPDDQAAQRRLLEPDGPITASTSPAASLELDLLQDRPIVARGAKTRCSTLTRPSGTGRRNAGAAKRCSAQQRRNAVMAGARPDQTLSTPIACSTGASARPSRIEPAIMPPPPVSLAPQHEIGAEAADADLEETGAGIGRADDRCAPVARLRLLIEHAIVVSMPASQQRRQHAHGVHDLGIAQRRLAPPLSGKPALVGRAERRPHDDLAAEREREQEPGAEERQPSEPCAAA